MTTTLRVRVRVRGWALAGGRPGVYASELAHTQSLHAFVTHALTPAAHRRVLSAETLVAAGDVHEIELEFVLARALLPANATLKFAAYVESATETGLTCRVDVGVASFLLADALASTPLARDICQRTGDAPARKGRLELTAATLTGGSFAPPSENAWYPPDAGRAEDRARFAALQARVDASIDGSIRHTYSRVLRARACPVLKNAHCPLYTRDVGRVHSGAYLLHLPAERPDEDVYRASLRAALRGAGMSAAFALRVMSAQFARPERMLRALPAVLNVLGNALTAATHALTVYENDFVDDAAGTPQPSEDFKDGEEEDGDDCEDSGKLNYGRAHGLRVLALARAGDRLRDDVFGRPVVGDRLWRAFARALFLENWYKFSLVMPAIVTNKNADVRAITDAATAQAHTFSVAMSYARLRRQLDDGGDARARAAIAAMRASAEMRAAARAECAFHAELPLLVLEGTTPADALPLPAAAYHANNASPARARALAAIVRARLAARMALAPRMPPAVQFDASQGALEYTPAMAAGEADVSAFYKFISSVSIDFRDAGVLQLAVATVQPDGSLSHGASWSEFARSDAGARTRFVPEYALDAPLRAAVGDFLAQLEPLPALKRDAVRAGHCEGAGPPPALVAGLRAIFGPEHVAVGEPPHDAEGAGELDEMPLPPPFIVLRARARDLDESALEKLLAGVRAERARFVGARATVSYLADVPVANETRMHDIVEHDVMLYLREQS